MKRILAVALNDLRIEFSHRSTLFTFLLLPLIFAAVIGFATGGFFADPNRDPRLPVAVVNLDEGALGERWVQDLERSDVLRVQRMEEAAALAQLRQDNLSGAVIVPAHLSADLLAGKPVDVELYQSAASNLGRVVEQAVGTTSGRIGRLATTALLSAEQAEARRPFADDAERAAYIEQALALADEAAATPAVVVEQTQAQTAQPQVVGGFTQSSPGQLVTWVLSTLLAGSEMLTAERTRGTLRRLLTMPARRGTLLAGKILGRLALGLVQMAIMIGFGWGVLGVDWGRSPLALVLVALSFGLAATALGMLIATISRTESQASGLVSLGTFLLAPLGGAWIPLEITPTIFQQVAQALPTTWAMRGFTDIIVRGQDAGGVLLECAVLLGMAALIFAFSIRRFRYE